MFHARVLLLSVIGSLAALTVPFGMASDSGKQNQQIDLTHAIAIQLPANADDLKPAQFRTPDGREGWVVAMPGRRPIATPAYADGTVFVGGGYGSHEFYAFNADTGALIWKINTGDDGPTAAVVEDGYVAFNTESCTLIVVEERTGKLVWKEWLGDPLMSQPAIFKGRLFMAYPAGQRGKPGRDYRLLAADLRTGKHLWEQTIPTDVISAPVISDDTVYVTCFDGTSFAFRAGDGSIVWQKKDAQAATSAPLITADQVIVAQKQVKDAKTYEGITRIEKDKGWQVDAVPLAAGSADHLSAGGGVALNKAQTAALDSSVGFAAAPPAAKLASANETVGVNTVVGGWAYQGSRPVAVKENVVNAQGNHVNAVNAASGKVAWRAEVKGSQAAVAGQVFSPPAAGKDSLYLSGGAGYLLKMRQDDGRMEFLYALNRPMVISTGFGPRQSLCGS